MKIWIPFEKKTLENEEVNVIKDLKRKKRRSEQGGRLK
jgi:hypothetical protein